MQIKNKLFYFFLRFFPFEYFLTKKNRMNNYKDLIFFILLVFVAVALLAIFSNAGLEKREQRQRQELQKLERKLDKVYNAIRVHDSILSRFDTAHVIRNYRDVYNSLIGHGVPYPYVFTQISVLEKGWRYEHAPYNNIFGFNIPGLKFKNKREAIRRLKKWVELSPPKPGEDPYKYIIRRRYNPYNFYISRVKSIKLDL